MLALFNWLKESVLHLELFISKLKSCRKMDFFI